MNLPRLFLAFLFDKFSLTSTEIVSEQTADNPWHREEEPLNHHETPGRQIKQSNHLSLPHQDVCNPRMDINVQQNKNN